MPNSTSPHSHVSNSEGSSQGSEDDDIREALQTLFDDGSSIAQTSDAGPLNTAAEPSDADDNDSSHEAKSLELIRIVGAFDTQDTDPQHLEALHRLEKRLAPTLEPATKTAAFFALHQVLSYAGVTDASSCCQTGTLSTAAAATESIWHGYHTLKHFEKASRAGWGWWSGKGSTVGTSCGAELSDALDSACSLARSLTASLASYSVGAIAPSVVPEEMIYYSSQWLGSHVKDKLSTAAYYAKYGVGVGCDGASKAASGVTGCLGSVMSRLKSSTATSLFPSIAHTT